MAIKSFARLMIQSILLSAVLIAFITNFSNASQVENTGSRYNKRNLMKMLKKTGQADAFQSNAVQDQSRLASPGNRPVGAYGMTFKLSKGLLFAWHSKSPHNLADTTKVIIVQHGVDRNANDYFTSAYTALKAAKSQNIPGANDNVLIIAPQFFATGPDNAALNATTLAWNEDNDWAMGEGSTHPSGSDLSPFSAYDELITIFSDKTQYPNNQQIVFVGHGGGALVFQRYAALRNTADSDPSHPALRYVIANPSSALYFTTDRSTTKYSTCDVLNVYYYGLDDYDAPYTVDSNSPDTMFKMYAARDVHYLVSLGDTSTTNGDQSCGARAQGGAPRELRTRTYWRYIHLLAGYKSNDPVLNGYPGTFASLTNNPKPSFYTTIKHQIALISDAGHNDTEVFTSPEGLQAIFGQ